MSTDRDGELAATLISLKPVGERRGAAMMRLLTRISRRDDLLGTSIDVVENNAASQMLELA